VCATVEPPLEQKADGQFAACHFAEPPKEALVAAA
jgi:hypothetical protein